MLMRPGLRRYVVVPVLINIVVFCVLAWIGINQFGELIDAFLPERGWLSFLRWILWPLFALAALLITFYSFTVVANLIAAPFNSVLAEQVERLLTGQPPPQPTGGILHSIVPSLLSELRKLSYFLLRAIPLLLLFLVPLLNVAAPILWLLFSAWYLALEYSDYPMANGGLGFAEQQKRMKRGRMTVLGFGSAVTLLMMIPLLNFVAMPAAVAGATALWCDQR